jgi:5-methylcytosine-specific restriction enzyme A
MVAAAPRPCRYAGCGVLVVSGFCVKHQQIAQREEDRRRGSANDRGYGSKWRKARAQYLSEHPLCECSECAAGAIRTRASSVVDHIVPHRGDLKLFWSRRNWRAMAKACHDKKTAREDGGFGNVQHHAAPPDPGAVEKLFDDAV